MLAGFDLSPHAMAVSNLDQLRAKIPVVIMNAATASIVRGSPVLCAGQRDHSAAYPCRWRRWAIKNNIKKVCGDRRRLRARDMMRKHSFA